MLSGVAISTSPLGSVFAPHLGVPARLDGLPNAGGAGDLAICDASGLETLVLKGPGAAQFLANRRLEVPDRVFRAGVLPGDGLIVRTGSQEVFLVDGPSGTICRAVAVDTGHGGRGVYRAPATLASLLISGSRATDVLVETCGVDLRFPTGDIVMTRVAGVSCSILFRTLLGHPVYQMWFDGSYGHYLGSTLLEIVREHNGAVTGISAYFREGESSG